MIGGAGEFLREFGGFGRGPGQFNVPDGIDEDGDGRLYVGDVRNDRVQVGSITIGCVFECVYEERQRGIELLHQLCVSFPYVFIV